MNNLKKDHNKTNNNRLIKVRGLYKKFCSSLKKNMHYGLSDILCSTLGLKTNYSMLWPGEFWALEDIHLDLYKNECLGIIGNNSSGKSTLLRLLGNIYLPDAGTIEITGKTGALISLGAGFHPHLTGRENIFLNGAILGMKKDEIELSMDKIIDFAQIKRFIDSPVANYSSGMVVRLGFSIALHSRPDIMLIDEILSVGDQGFKQKCLNQLNQMKSQKKDKNKSSNGVQAIIMVSHDLEQIRKISDRVIVMDRGRILESGRPDEMIEKYMALDKKRVPA